MVSVLASSAVDHGFEPRSGQTKDYKIGICCFSAKHAALRRESKDLLTRNQEVSCRLLFQWTSTKNPTKRGGLVQSGHHHLIEWKLFSPWYTGSWKIVHSAMEIYFIFHNKIMNISHKYKPSLIGFVKKGFLIKMSHRRHFVSWDVRCNEKSILSKTY